MSVPSRSNTTTGVLRAFSAWQRRSTALRTSVLLGAGGLGLDHAQGHDVSVTGPCSRRATNVAFQATGFTDH